MTNREKYICTLHFFSGLQLKVVKKMLDCEYDTHGQFRVVCKARGIDHANELTQDLGRKVFNRAYSSETANQDTITVFEKNPYFTYIIYDNLYFGKYISNIELKKIVELLEENKGEQNER